MTIPDFPVSDGLDAEKAVVFDPSLVDNDHEARMWLWRLHWHAPDYWCEVSSVAQMRLLLGANIYQIKRLGSEAVYQCGGTTTYASLGLINTPDPANAAGTDREDDAAWLISLESLVAMSWEDGTHVSDIKLSSTSWERIFRLARKGAQREPVAEDGWQPISDASHKPSLAGAWRQWRDANIYLEGTHPMAKLIAFKAGYHFGQVGQFNCGRIPGESEAEFYARLSLIEEEGENEPNPVPATQETAGADGEDMDLPPYVTEPADTHKPRRMAEGCCSAISPCGHQQSDPYSLCDVCAKANALPSASPDPSVQNPQGEPVAEGCDDQSISDALGDLIALHRKGIIPAIPNPVLMVMKGARNALARRAAPPSPADAVAVVERLRNEWCRIAESADGEHGVYMCAQVHACTLILAALRATPTNKEGRS